MAILALPLPTCNTKAAASYEDGSYQLNQPLIEIGKVFLCLTDALGARLLQLLLFGGDLPERIWWYMLTLKER